jgi:hypothetical protein
VSKPDTPRYTRGRPLRLTCVPKIFRLQISFFIECYIESLHYLTFLFDIRVRSASKKSPIVCVRNISIHLITSKMSDIDIEHALEELSLNEKVSLLSGLSLSILAHCTANLKSRSRWLAHSTNPATGDPSNSNVRRTKWCSRDSLF